MIKLKNMAFYAVTLAVIGFSASAIAQNTPIFFTQGGATFTVGSAGTLDVNGTADFTGATVTSLGTVATVDINGGTIDGAVVGGSSTAAGSFTTLGATGALTASGGGTMSGGAFTFNSAGNFTDGLQIGGAAITSTAAELNLLDGSLEANTAASVAPILDTAKALRTDANVGTAGTGVTAVEYGDGYNHVTVLTLASTALTPTTIPADAEGAGVIVYTFPAGDYLFTACHMDITAFTGTGFAATNAVEMGIGSLISSGDIATLTSATMEDCVTGQTVADISSPATEKSTVATAGAPLLFESGDSHVIHLNVAGTWDDTFTAPITSGMITIYWTFLGA